MGYSDLNVISAGNTGTTFVTAYGGTRRQRGAAIAAWARKNPGMQRFHLSYSETYGFQSATYARYRKPSE